MGYGGKEALLTHTGRPGDAGLDGIIRQDALGLDQVGVQAKRYDRESAVQRPEMQAFVGALQGAQTTRGVFVTTGRFSSGARQFADQVAMRLVLIDGTELTRFMVRYDGDWGLRRGVGNHRGRTPSEPAKTAGTHRLHRNPSSQFSSQLPSFFPVRPKRRRRGRWPS